MVLYILIYAILLILHVGDQVMYGILYWCCGLNFFNFERRYIVYDINQVNIKYLLKVNFKYK